MLALPSFFQYVTRIRIEDKIRYSALLVFILTAYFSIGHHQSDEHFQILEFAQYKLGHIDANDLPWEFHEKMRPSIQPWIAFLVIKGLNFIQISNPFTITTILRIFSAILLWFVIHELSKVLCKKYFPDKKWSNLFYTSSFFLWFVPYLSGRFSSENYSALFLLLGLLFLIKNHKGYGYLVSVGVLFGLSVLFRYQLGIAIVGIYLWLLLKAETPIIKLIYSAISFAMIIAVGLYLDYLFYNEFVFTPYNYLKLNLIEGRASDFGTSPWWQYVYYFLVFGIPPISIVLLAFFLKGIVKLRNSVFAWSIIPFILIHFFIAHKELRFFFPINYLFIFLSIYGLMDYFRGREVKRYQQRIFYVAVWINVVLLLYMMAKPANEIVSNYKYLYDNIEPGKRNILSLKTDVYSLNFGLKSTIYSPANYISDHVESMAKIQDYLEENQIDSCFFVYGKFEVEDRIEGYNIEKVFSVYPNWIEKIKWIDWQKALNTHCVFLITRDKKE